MHYDLLPLAGAYDHYNVPEVTTYSQLVTMSQLSADPPVLGVLGAVCYGPEIVVSIPIPAADLVRAHAAIYLSMYDEYGIHMIYTIDHMIDVSTMSNGQAVRIKARLNAVLTIKCATDEPYRLASQIYRITRWLPPNFERYGGSVYPKLELAPDDAPTLTMSEYQEERIAPSYPDDYVVIVTLQRKPSLDTGWILNTDLDTGDQTAPYAFLYWGFSVKVGNNWTPISATVLTGVYAATGVQLMFGDLGENQNNVYRVQMIPKRYCDAMRGGAALGNDYAYYEHDAKRHYITPLVDPYKVTYDTDLSLDPTIDRLEAYGSPKARVYLKGQMISEVPVINASALPDLGFALRWTLTIIFTSGLECYLTATTLEASGAGYEVLLDKVAIALPEIAVTTDGVTKWQDTASRQWLSSVASVGMGLMTRGTSVSGAVTSLTQEAVGMIAAGNASLHEIHSAGTGASGVYATDPYLPWIVIKYFRYGTEALEARDAWYREHGVAYPTVRYDLRRTANQTYDFWQGSGDVRIMADQLHYSPISQDELNTELNAQLSHGIRVWSYNPVFPLPRNRP